MALSQINLDACGATANQYGDADSFSELYPMAFRMGVRIREVKPFIAWDEDGAHLRELLSPREDPEVVNRVLPDRSWEPHPDDLVILLGEKARETRVRPLAAYIYAAIDMARHARWLIRPSLAPIGRHTSLFFDLCTAAHFIKRGQQHDVFDEAEAERAIKCLCGLAKDDATEVAQTLHRGFEPRQLHRETKTLRKVVDTMEPALRSMEPSGETDLNSLYNMTARMVLTTLREMRITHMPS